MSQASFQKQQREKARRERNAAKSAKRAERAEAKADEPLAAAPITDQDAVLAELAVLHERFESGGLDFEDFEEAKQRLMAQLDVR